MNTKEWAAIHRKHHAKVETKDDPHTPIFFGLENSWHLIAWIFFVGVSLYVKESHNKQTLLDYGHNTPNDSWERNLFTPHNYLGVGLILGIINVTLFGLPGLLVWGVQALWIPVFAAGVINGMGHWYGYRNYIHSDQYPNVKNSTNLYKWAIFIGGEELHNNHHANASSPFFAHKPGEFDWGGVVVKMLCSLGWAKLSKPIAQKE